MASPEALASFREQNGDRPPTAEELSEMSGLDVALCADILNGPQQEAPEEPEQPAAEQPKKRRKKKTPAPAEETTAEEPKNPKARSSSTKAKAKAQHSKCAPSDMSPPEEKPAVTPVTAVAAAVTPPVTPPPVEESRKPGQQLLEFKLPQAWSSIHVGFPSRSSLVCQVSCRKH